MRIRQRLLAIPLLLAASAAPALGDVRDRAGLFSPEAIRRADSELARITRETGVPVTIETVAEVQGRSMGQALAERGRSEGLEGLFVLIAKNNHKVEAGGSPAYDRYFSRPLYDSIYEAFLPGFKRNDFDRGLADGVTKIDATLRELKAEHGSLTPSATRRGARPPAHGQPAAPGPRLPAHGRSGVGMLIGLVLLVLGVMLVFRLLGALFGAGRGYGPGGYGPGPGGMRGPGYGPGYGGPGYGGGGGGFMSSLFGGIGGAMAGNWLYDQFSGRHHQYDQTGYVPTGQEPAAPTDAGGDWGTGSDAGGDWGGGGGDVGGGGDWGGGGGGDWGGGGGGDWGGGGGGDGGSW